MSKSDEDKDKAIKECLGKDKQNKCEEKAHNSQCVWHPQPSGPADPLDKYSCKCYDDVCPAAERNICENRKLYDCFSEGLPIPTLTQSGIKLDEQHGKCKEIKKIKDKKLSQCWKECKS